MTTGSPLPPVDIELLLEGSYPYVTGGVSAWVHRLVTSLPEYRFGLTHIGAKRSDPRKIRYDLPANVAFLQNLYLHDITFLPTEKAPRPDNWNRLFKDLQGFHAQIRQKPLASFVDLVHRMIRPEQSGNLERLLSDPRAFEMLTRLYDSRWPTASFLDYFWTWRFNHIPLLQLLLARPVPAKVTHAICTGYAGFLGCLRKLTRKTPLLLTEHGIYTRERTIEITQADWIRTDDGPDHLVRVDQGVFKNIWLNFFQSLGRWSYELSDNIITLFEGNRVAQIGLGADPTKIQVIPNGIDLPRFLDLRPMNPPDPQRFHVGFVGRVVPIKDVKTFLKAAKIVLNRFPHARFSIVGPIDEDEEYARECQQLAADLDLAKRLSFLGKQNVLEIYPKVDVIVLTSLSEGQPLSLLEAMAAGIPCVATDVGSCRELLTGKDPEDRTLGSCGAITSLRSPSQTARAIIDLVRDGDRYLKMVRAGKSRVRTFYREDEIYGRYRRLYKSLIERADHPETPPVETASPTPSAVPPASPETTPAGEGRE